MKNFEDKLRESAQRLVEEDNRKLHLPSNPLSQKAFYWGWVATPAAAVAGVVLGMSLNLFVTDEPAIQYVHNTDTVQVERTIHDTLYLTQVVEVERPVLAAQSPDSIIPEQEEIPACTSIQCDGINYALLALK
jgi:hypothetical protein